MGGKLDAGNCYIVSDCFVTGTHTLLRRQESGPLYERAMVMNVLDHSFDVLIVKLGVIKRVYCEVCSFYRTYLVGSVTGSLSCFSA